MIGGGLCTYFNKQDQRSIVGPLNKTIWNLKSYSYYNIIFFKSRVEFNHVKWKQEQ